MLPSSIGLNGLMNGPAFERVADPSAVPDGLAGRLIARYIAGVLGSASRATNREGSHDI